MKRAPQVLHIGFSKCASTYLRSLFRAHPSVHLVFKSGFFTPFLETEMTFPEYQSLFLDSPGIVNVESDEHLTLPGVHPTLGVRTTNLAEFERVAERIREYLPDIRIIMVIRNQASLIVSRYSEYLITGGSLSFDRFADELLGDTSGGNVWYQNYYCRMIGMLEQRFPRDHILVLLQEAMREDASTTASTIAEFIGLHDTLKLRDGLRSERRSLSAAGMRLLASINGRIIRRPSFGGAPPATRVPLFVFRNVVRAVRACDYYALARISPKSSAVMTADRSRRILAHFREDNLRLQEYFGRDLAALGYL